MTQLKETYLEFWAQLETFIGNKGLDWQLATPKGHNDSNVKIGSSKYRICLTLNSISSKNFHSFLSASFWIPNSKETFELLKSKKVEIEAEMEKSLIWDDKPGKKASSIWITAPIDFSNKKNWPQAFEWFANNAPRISNACNKHLA